jgi:hypothetical protein
VKLLIIAGPHEADRIRRAAVRAGFEAAAVEPGESLSGWITATRPDFIILACRIVSPDPNVALGKVRSIPRGRVPIFLVGDPDEEARSRDLADGFFARPFEPSELLARARDVVARATPLVASPSERSLFTALAEDIDADFDAEIRDVVRAVGALRQARAPAAADRVVSTGPESSRFRDDDGSALEELKDETSQKTLEVPLAVSAALIETGRGPGTPASDRALVLARYALVAAGDYFQILGLSRDVAGPDIERAHERAMSELSSDTLHPTVVAELRDEIHETRAVVTEAARLLMNDRLRGQYRRHLPPAASPAASPAVSPSGTDSEPAPAALPLAMSAPVDAKDSGS